MVDEVLKMAK
jgi:hypothetical protein